MLGLEFCGFASSCFFDLKISCFCLEVHNDGTFTVLFEGYDEKENVTVGMIKLIAKKKRKRSEPDRDGDHRRKRSRRSREGSRDRSRRGERDRDKDRHKDRDRDRHRRRRRSRSRERRSKDRDEVRGTGDEYPEALTNELLDKLVKQREARAAHAIGRNYARIPFGLKRGLSVKQETATTRERSASPVERRRPRLRVSQRIAPSAPKKRKIPSHLQMHKMQQLRDRYGDASAIGGED